MATDSTLARSFFQANMSAFEAYYACVQRAQEAQNSFDNPLRYELSVPPVLAKLGVEHKDAIEIPSLAEEEDCIQYLTYYWSMYLLPHNNSQNIIRWICQTFKNTGNKAFRNSWDRRPEKDGMHNLGKVNALTSRITIHGRQYERIYWPLVRVPHACNWGFALLMAAVCPDVLGLVKLCADPVVSAMEADLREDPTHVRTMIRCDNERITCFSQSSHSRFFMNCRRFFFGLPNLSYAKLAALKMRRSRDNIEMHFVPRDLLFKEIQSLADRRKRKARQAGAEAALVSSLGSAHMPRIQPVPRKRRGDYVLNQLRRCIETCRTTEVYLRADENSLFVEPVAGLLAELSSVSAHALSSFYSLGVDVDSTKEEVLQYTQAVSTNPEQVFRVAAVVASEAAALAQRELPAHIQTMQANKIRREDEKDEEKEEEEEKEAQEDEKEQEDDEEEEEQEEEEQEEEEAEEEGDADDADVSGDSTDVIVEVKNMQTTNKRALPSQASTASAKKPKAAYIASPSLLDNDKTVNGLDVDEDLDFLQSIL